MEKFDSQEYRDDLALKVNSSRAAGNKEEAMEIQSNEKESTLYLVSEIISKLKNILSKEYEDYLSQFKNFEDSEEIKLGFDISNIENQLTLEHKLYIEAEILEDFTYHKWEANNVPNEIDEYIEQVKSLLSLKQEMRSWGIDSGPELFDEITKGEFLDNRNLNHVVLAQKSSSRAKPFLIKPFDLKSEIMVNDDETYEKLRVLYLSAGYNPYAKQISKPLVLLNPRDIAARKFIEDSHGYADISTLLEDIKTAGDTASLCRDEHGRIGYYAEEGSSMLNRLLFLAQYPIIPQIGQGLVINYSNYNKLPEKQIPEYRWCEIASEVVNLRTAKLYKRKHSIEDDGAVNASTQYYRKLLKDEFDIDYEIDIQGNIKDIN